MTSKVKILSAGVGVSLQDGGRRGYLRFGVTEAGPMDRLAMATANCAVGALPDATVIEISLGGFELTVDECLPMAIAGGDFEISIDGRRLPPSVRFELAEGSRLRVRAGSRGAWCYLAFGGHVDIATTLGSNATHTHSGLGGLCGRALVAGDEFLVGERRPVDWTTSEIIAPWLRDSAEVVRVVLGPQDDYFSDAQLDVLTHETWTVSHHSNRMAYFLKGASIAAKDGLSVISDGVVMGAIQVSGSGEPMVLMADRQVTGGYPKIASVIKADLGALAQLWPGAQFRFAVTTIEEAVKALKSQRGCLAAIRFEPLLRTEFSSEFLLQNNLIGGVADVSA